MLFLAIAIGLVIFAVFTVILAERGKGLVAAGFTITLLALALVFSVSFVQTGNVQLLRSFGVIQTRTLTEGIQWHAPWQVTEDVNIQRRQVDVDSTKDAAVKSLTLDQVDLDVSVTFPYRLNPTFAGLLYAKVGDQDGIFQLLQRAAQSALRDTLATLPWEDAAINKRSLFESGLGNSILAIVSNDLQRAGLTEADAKGTILFFTLIIAQAAPPERLRRELEEKQAAEIELGRQQKLTAIAGEVANRRGAEGVGIAALLSKLPHEGSVFTPSEIANLINANAAETRAQALLKAVEAGQLRSIVFSEQPATIPVK